jgi:hypothetical protein
MNALSSNFLTFSPVVHPAYLKKLKEDRCSICLKNFDTTKSIVCHYLKEGKPMCPHHEECFQNWAKEKPTCPIDRSSITSIDGVPISIGESREDSINPIILRALGIITGVMIFAIGFLAHDALKRTS